MRSLLVAPSGDRTLIELKAVDAAWPLVGTAEASPPQPIADALAQRDGHYGLLIDPLVLDRLGLKTGDLARLGSATFRVAGALTAEPDRVATPSVFGPRVLMSEAALAETGLIAPGTLARYDIRATVLAHGGAGRHGTGASEIRRPGLAHPRSVRGRSAGRALPRPDQPVPDLGGPDVAAGRRHRRGQRRRRLARSARPHHRHAALPWRLADARVGGLPAAGHVPRGHRHRDRTCGRRRGNAWPRTVAGRVIAGSRGRRRVPRTTAAGRRFRPAHRPEFRAVAAGASGTYPRRGAVPRHDRPRANPSRHLGDRGQCRCRRGDCRTDHRLGRRSLVRAVFLRRSAGDVGPVPAGGTAGHATRALGAGVVTCHGSGRASRTCTARARRRHR